MIPYAELERAIARWKARQAGHEVPATVHEIGAEAVVHESSSYGHAQTDVEHEVGGSGLISIEDEPTRH
jgi:hypothetical protein